MFPPADQRRTPAITTVSAYSLQHGPGAVLRPPLLQCELSPDSPCCTLRSVWTSGRLWQMREQVGRAGAGADSGRPEEERIQGQWIRRNEDVQSAAAALSSQRIRTRNWQRRSCTNTAAATDMPPANTRQREAVTSVRAAAHPSLPRAAHT